MSEESHLVLHIVDRTTGGVPIAVAGYISNGPRDVEHLVLTPFDSEGAPPRLFGSVNTRVLPLVNGHFRRVRQIATVARDLRPRAIHAHSSFAGGYTRLAIGRRNYRVVYTPHCFGFERNDLAPAARRLFRAVEWILGWNTTILAACSQAEASTAQEMSSTRGRVRFLPNIASVPPAQGATWNGRFPLKVAMSGRVSAQKDPQYFADVVRRLREHVQVEATWIGSGDQRLSSELARQDVMVTGWMPVAELQEILSQTHLYMHSAAWEGFPISALDAHALDRPMMVRNIRAFAGVHPAGTIEGGMADLLTALASAESFSDWASKNRAHWSDYLAENTVAGQRAALESAWGIT